MAKHVHHMVQGDTGPALIFDVVNYDDSPYDPTSATARLVIKDTSTGDITNTGHDDCVWLGDPVNWLQYSFVSGDIPNATKYICDLEIVDANGKLETEYEYIEIIARPRN